MTSSKPEKPLMQNHVNRTLAIAAATLLLSSAAAAKEYITCKSNDYHYKSCTLDRPGHVRLAKQLSEVKCRQGKNWDYDRRSIWVDDGCAAKFAVNYNEQHDSGSDVGKAIGAIAGAVIIGALANQLDKHDKYLDDDYHGGRHSSYVPSWMVGKFRGYNDQYNSEVTLKITSDGVVKANIEGTKVQGFVNNEELHVGSRIFDVTRSHNGFYTNQHGDRTNEVKYTRIR
jgi:hypothetical protein